MTSQTDRTEFAVWKETRLADTLSKNKEAAGYRPSHDRDRYQAMVRDARMYRKLLGLPETST